MIYDVVDEQIDTTSKAFLGLTVACARCHDHKFDPILTKDYYSLASIFASTEDFRNLGRPGVGVVYLLRAARPGGVRALPGASLAHVRQATRDGRGAGGGLDARVRAAAAEDRGVPDGGMEGGVAKRREAGGAGRETGGAGQRGCTRPMRRRRQGYLKKWFEATDATIAQVAREYQEDYIKTATQAGRPAGHTGASGSPPKCCRIAICRRVRKLARRQNPFFAAATFNGGPMELADSPRVAELRARVESAAGDAAARAADGERGHRRRQRRAARVPARRSQQPRRAGGEAVPAGAGGRVAAAGDQGQRTAGAGEVAGEPRAIRSPRA